MQKKNSGHKTIVRVVAIGASAGGLEAVSSLLKYLTASTGMAFFYVQHLSPDHESNLSTLLARATKMVVLEARNNLVIKPDHVYVCTPNKEMVLVEGKIKLLPRNSHKLPYLPINSFFTSLAETYGDRVIGIVLSGNATDGTEGLKAIRDAGGITFAQDSSAKHSSMPDSAIGQEAAHFILSPKEIARKLSVLNLDTYRGESLRKPNHIIRDDSPHLKTIIDILSKETGVDFSHYKLSTLKRRLNYRMMTCAVNTLENYVRLLGAQHSEVIHLHKDLLINVTGFFRDAKTFQYLKSTLLPVLFAAKSQGTALRIWIPACSTGEEVYSMAMLVAELQATQTPKISVQIFASDLSESVLQDARKGEYTKDDTAHISPARLKRFFSVSGDHYRVNKELREMCVFAHHNILSDPPFSRMDLISCCNLLIYFDAPAQRKALATMNFALNNRGYLVLGKSESIGASSPFFAQAHKTLKIYSRKASGARKVPDLLPRLPGILPSIKAAADVRKNDYALSSGLDRVIDAALLERYMPACAIINKEMEILKFRGSTSLYLSHPSGNASLNILKMTRTEFAFELRNTIQQALKIKDTVRKSDLEIKIDTVFRKMTVEVSPLDKTDDELLLLVVFSLQEQSEPADTAAKKKGSPSSALERKNKKLMEELRVTRSEMHAVIEAQEAAFEELQAASEEIVSTNEEFQTLNEELETSKEEIEATNEELISTNQELQMRNDLLTESYQYSEAIIATIHEPLIILDSQLVIKSANRAYYKIFLATPEATVGFSLFEVGNKQWDHPELRVLLDAVVHKHSDFNDFELHREFHNVGEKIMLLNAHRIIQKTHREQFILLAVEDITERTRHHLHEKEILENDLNLHKADNMELEKAVQRRTHQLEAKNLDLQEANKDLTAFTYISSHDLQEPLRKIRNFVSVLLEGEKKKLSRQGRIYLDRTYDTAKHMQTLIEDLLVYSRTKNLERKFENIRLQLLTDEVAQDYHERMVDKKATLQCSKSLKVHVIRFQFKQLLSNLISNSLKFAKTGRPCRIHIRSNVVGWHDPLLIKHFAADHKRAAHINYCHLVYTDNGIGFDPQYGDRIFNVFQRLHSNEEYAGTGMGLAICKRIVENHNGAITATGKVNKGARFDIYIPADPLDKRMVAL